MPDDAALLERLRGVFPGFGVLPGQRLTNGLLRSELERHVGGASHLPPQFRRKRGGQEHRITGQPSRAVLLAAWDAFISVPGNGPNKFDPSSVYADRALQGVDRGRPAAACSTEGAGGAVVCERRGKGTRIDGEQAYQGKIPMFWDRKILASPCFGRRVELLPMKLRSRASAEANSVRERAARS
jgi:hypothetical protein